MGLFGKSHDAQIRELDERIAAEQEELRKVWEEIHELKGELKEANEALFDIEVALGLKKKERTITTTGYQSS